MRDFERFVEIFEQALLDAPRRRPPAVHRRPDPRPAHRSGGLARLPRRVLPRRERRGDDRVRRARRALPGPRPRPARQPRARPHRRPAHREVRGRRGRAARADPRPVRHRADARASSRPSRSPRSPGAARCSPTARPPRRSTRSPSSRPPTCPAPHYASPLDVLDTPVVGKILWARSATEAEARRFLRAMNGTIAIYGHDVIPEGFETNGDEQMVVSTSFGVFDSNKVYVSLDLGAAVPRDPGPADRPRGPAAVPRQGPAPARRPAPGELARPGRSWFAKPLLSLGFMASGRRAAPPDRHRRPDLLSGVGVPIDTGSPEAPAPAG